MNLVISGPIDDTLRNLVVALSRPRRVVSLHAKADRLEGVDDGMDVKSQVAALCDAARVDHAYVEEGVRFADFKLLAMDMDSTLITIECIDEIADFAGKKKEVAAITAAAMRGELDFAESLRRRVALLSGTSQNVLARVQEERLHYTTGSAELIRRAHAENIFTALVSGGFTYFADHIKILLDLDAAFANELEIKRGRLTGRLVGEIIDQFKKAKIIDEIMRQNKCESRRVLVIGDGANDIEMMQVAEYSIAFHAKPITNKFASASIKHGTLKTVLDYFA